MEKTKNNFLIFAVLILLFLVACGTNSTKSNENSITGTEGLTIDFLKNTPPKSVFEDNSFPLIIRVRNSGTYSIPKDPPEMQGLISIGRERDYIPRLTLEADGRLLVLNDPKKDNEIFFFVDGRSQINPQGDELIASLAAKTSKLDAQSERRISTLTASICYPYKTSLSTTVCIDPDIAGIRPGKKACTIGDQPFSAGQGAPMAITKIETLMIPDIDKDEIKPQFLIYVENKGGGNPVNLDGFRYPCSNDYEIKDATQGRWNVAALRAFTANPNGNGPLQLVCCPNQNSECPDNPNDWKDTNKITGFIRLRDNKDFVRCTFPNGIPKNFDAYASPLSVEIDYGYVQTISTNFIIQKPPRY